MSKWRTVQIFLSPRHPAVYEVEIDNDEGTPRCSCPTYSAKSACRHTRAVERRMEESGGQYPIMLEDRIEEDVLRDSIDDPVKFRDVIYRFGKVEVL